MAPSSNPLWKNGSDISAAWEPGELSCYLGSPFWIFTTRVPCCHAHALCMYAPSVFGRMPTSRQLSPQFAEAMQFWCSSYSCNRSWIYCRKTGGCEFCMRVLSKLLGLSRVVFVHLARSAVVLINAGEGITLLPCAKIAVEVGCQYSDVENGLVSGCPSTAGAAMSSKRLDGWEPSPASVQCKHPVPEPLLRSALCWHGQSKLRIRAESATVRDDCFNCREPLKSRHLFC